MSSVQIDPAHTTEEVLVWGDGVVVVGHGGMRRLGIGELSGRGGDLSVLGHRLPGSDAPCSEQKEMSQRQMSHGQAASLRGAWGQACPSGTPAAPSELEGTLPTSLHHHAPLRHQGRGGSSPSGTQEESLSQTIPPPQSIHAGPSASSSRPTQAAGSGALLPRSSARGAHRCRAELGTPKVLAMVTKNSSEGLSTHHPLEL